MFLSPPWGGPDYAKVITYDMKTMLKPHDGSLDFFFVLFGGVGWGELFFIFVFLDRSNCFNRPVYLNLSCADMFSSELQEKLHLELSCFSQEMLT